MSDYDRCDRCDATYLDNTIRPKSKKTTFPILNGSPRCAVLHSSNAVYSVIPGKTFPRYQ